MDSELLTGNCQKLFGVYYYLLSQPSSRLNEFQNFQSSAINISSLSWRCTSESATQNMKQVSF